MAQIFVVEDDATIRNELLEVLERNGFETACCLSFDRVVEVMKQTGHDLPSIYKETGEGGLAREYDPDK